MEFPDTCNNFAHNEAPSDEELEAKQNHNTPVELISPEEIADLACRGAPEYDEINHLFILFSDRITNTIWSRSIPLLCEAYIKDFPATIYKEAMQGLIKSYSPGPDSNKPVDLVRLTHLEFMHQLVILAYEMESSCSEAELQIKKMGRISSTSPPLPPSQKLILEYPEPPYLSLVLSPEDEDVIEYNRRFSRPITEFDSISNFSDSSAFECLQSEKKDHVPSLAGSQALTLEAEQQRDVQTNVGDFVENTPQVTQSLELRRVTSGEPSIPFRSSVTDLGAGRLASSSLDHTRNFALSEGEMSESEAEPIRDDVSPVDISLEQEISANRYDLNSNLRPNPMAIEAFDVDNLLSDTDTPDSDVPDDASSDFSIPSSVSYGSQRSLIEKLAAESQERHQTNITTSIFAGQDDYPVGPIESNSLERLSAELPLFSTEAADGSATHLNINEDCVTCSFPREDLDYINSLVPIFQAKHGDLNRMTNDKFSLIAASMRDQSTINAVIENQKVEIDEQSINLNELKNDVSSLKDLEAELSNTICTIEKDLEIQHQSSNELAKQNTELKERFSELNRLSGESEKDQLLLSVQIESAENNFKRLTEDIKNLEDDITSLNQQISSNEAHQSDIMQLQQEKAELERVNGNLTVQAFANRSVNQGRAKPIRPHVEELFDLEREDTSSESGSALSPSLNLPSHSTSLLSESLRYSEILAKQKEVAAALSAAEAQLREVTAEREAEALCSTSKSIAVQTSNMHDFSAQASFTVLDAAMPPATSRYQTAEGIGNGSVLRERRLMQNETDEMVLTHSHASSMTAVEDVADLNLLEEFADDIPEELPIFDLSWVIIFLLCLLLAWLILLSVHVTLDRYASYTPKAIHPYIILTDPLFRGFVSKALIYVEEHFILVNTY
ncbi:hypothetical protein DSO57_1017783 [Entomophthora muscae]|nr:hypothetical protein DSO57_1017783 [Entomophthora muscae]